MTVVLWTCAVCITLIAAVLVYYLVPAILEWREDRRAEPRDDMDITDEIRAIKPARTLARPIAPSPLIPTRQLATKRDGHYARLDQQARRAAVVTAAVPEGPFTREYNGMVAELTGRAPRGRGPREADVRRTVPAQAWQQEMLPIDVGAS